MAHLFDKQRAFVDDPAKFKVAQCSRRAGKSEMAASLLFKSALENPNSTALYVGLTRSSSKNIMWPKLLDLKERYKIECVMLEASLEVKFPNASKIWLVGADMQNFIDRLRGGKYPNPILDEVQSMGPHVRTLVDDILTPAIMDYAKGSIFMFGTPGPIPAGFFYDVTERGLFGYSKHSWTMLDNPYIPNAKGFIDDLLVRNSWTVDNPTYRREYLNEWVLDTDALVYKFKDPQNVIQSTPLSDDHSYVIGVDYGWNDKTTFAVLAYSRYSPKIIVVHTEGHGEMIPSQIAGRLGQLAATYKPERIVADTGGLGKSITEEMIRRYSIPVHAAEKTDKATWISLINGDFIDGNLLVMDRNTDLISQYQTLTKDPKDPSKEDPKLPNDYCDSVLYSARYIRAYHNAPRAEPKTIAQIYQETEDAIWGQEAERLEKEENKEWWEK